jgi:hypothetical protein
VLLALVSLFLGHDAVYAAEHGIGAGFASAMTELGHGAYWGPVSCWHDFIFGSQGQPPTAARVRTQSCAAPTVRNLLTSGPG